MLGLYCIGAQKAGTTWLYENFIRHPDVQITRAGKEIHFWDAYYHKGIDWYDNLFSEESNIQVDVTPAYAVLAEEKIKECYQHYPDIKIIYIVREPIDRTWSAFMMYLSKNKYNSSLPPPDGLMKKFLERKQVRERNKIFSAYQSWASVFPAENILVLHFDDLKQKPKKFLGACFKHADLDSGAYDFDQMITGKVHQRTYNFEMKPKHAEWIRATFQEDWRGIQPYVTRV